MKPCSYQQNLPDKRVQCLLCPFGCRLAVSEIGICHARQNQNGHLVALNDNLVLALALDPIEKKPLYHYYPGSKILSIGTFGCNLRCKCCQNHELVAAYPTLTPESSEISMSSETLIKGLIDATLREKAIGIAFTYNEPVIWFDTVLPIAKAFKAANLKTVMVTNGFINQAPLLELLPVIDAFNVDLKASDDNFYHKWCGGQMIPVIETLKTIYGRAHLEVTTLLIEGINTSDDSCHQLGRLISGIGADIPLHLSRYFPAHLMTLPPTPSETLLRAQGILKQYLNHVYIGNVAHANIDTHCETCGELLIQRTLTPITCYLENDRCPRCQSGLVPYSGERQ